MAPKPTPMTEKLYDFTLKWSLKEHPVLKKLRDITAKLPDYVMQISPDQGQFMAFLIKLIGATKTLDIGVYTGYSALAVALALPDNGQVIACDINKTTSKIAKDHWAMAQVDHKISLKLAPATHTLKELIDAGHANSFDFAFIDANKDQYCEYYELCLKLIRPGGLIAVDNVFRGGRIMNPDGESNIATRALLEKTYNDNRIEESIVPIADGLLLIRKLL